MVTLRKRVALLGLAAVAVLAWLRLGGGDSGVLPGLGGGETVGSAPEQPLPRIGLGRLDEPREAAPLGQRNLFDFGPPPAAAATPTPPPTPEPAAAATPPPRPVAPPAPQAAPLEVTYIGKVEGQGARVAVLLSDKKEVLTGREGDLVANRLRIVKIGLESVDVQDVGSDRVRRLPLEGR